MTFEARTHRDDLLEPGLLSSADSVGGQILNMLNTDSLSTLHNSQLMIMQSRPMIREWSLITGRGGLQNGRGGAREVLPLRKGGGGKSFSHSEGGAQKVLG